MCLNFLLEGCIIHYLSIHPLMDTWVVSPSGCCELNINSCEYECTISLQDPVFGSLGHTHSRGVAGSRGNSMCSFFRTYHSSCNHSTSYQQCTESPVPSRPRQPSLLSFFGLLMDVRWHFMALMYSSPVQ